ncbi:hypothetical protein AGMMS49938_12220 [Fibrobacterales bacterium]|nr:hypothetical protein AGMMS49938_12220 [Fibrobacterales bacterium]
MRIKFLIISAICYLLLSCAQKPPVNSFFDESKIPLADSAKVKATILVSHNNSKEKLSAVFFAVPNKKYRLELSGTLGFSAASLLWADGKWSAVFPQDNRYAEGAGDCVYLPIYGGADIHKFASLFLGQRVENISCSSKDFVSTDAISTDAAPKDADKKGALTKDAAFSNLKIEYRENFAVLSQDDSKNYSQSNLQNFSQNADSLIIEIKSIDSKAVWKNSVWNLPKPEGYKYEN